MSAEGPCCVDEAGRCGVEGVATDPGALTRRALLRRVGAIAAGVPLARSATRRTSTTAQPQARPTTTTATTAPAPRCPAAPEHDAGEYYRPDAPYRSDLSEGVAGTALTMRVRVVESERCAPVRGLLVDVWHADALGAYTGAGGALRGVRHSGIDGIAEFTTIVPGWYQGRASHVHVIVRSGGSRPVIVHTGTIFFDDDVVAVVAQQQPYRSNPVPRTPLVRDPIFRDQGGSGSLSSMKVDGAGFVSDVTIAVQLR